MLENLFTSLFFIAIYLYFARSFNIYKFTIYDSSDDEKEKEAKEEEKEEEKETEKKEIVRFENKYETEFANMTSGPTLDKDQLEQLKNSIIMENTPLGNVVMFYDSKRETFAYYSDSVIPYRYLETIGRKYVITYHCKSLFINMNEELKTAQEKKEEKEKEEKEKEEREKEEKEREKVTGLPEQKKNVFAKFKNYNKDSGKSSATKPATNSNTMANALLKENANRYTCDGRFSNFIILKKVDKKLIDKRLTMTFADFKKMNQKNSPSLM